MATLTADAAQSYIQPREDVVGPTVMAAKFTSTAALSIGDTIQMIKIPANATLIDLKVAGNIPGSSVTIVNVGYTGQAGATTTFATNLTFSATTLFSSLGTALPAYLTVSDDTTVQYSLLTMTVASGTASGTTGSVLQMVATYCRRGTGGAV